jgi:hypothetical protein
VHSECGAFYIRLTASEPKGAAVEKLKCGREPYIDESGVLVIRIDAPRRYRWWSGGQPIYDTLKELKASPEVIEKYLGVKGDPI